MPVFNTDPPRPNSLTADANKLTLVIGKYHTTAFSATGRGTVGYIAYVVGKKRLVFLKDTWRGDSPTIPEELDIYRHLYELGVENIAEIVAGGDVQHVQQDDKQEYAGFQYTRTQEYLRKGDRNIIRRKHYRLVSETLGLPLADHKHGLALTHVLRDAVRGE